MSVDIATEIECTIANVCRRFGLTARAVRHYEHQGLVHPHRDGQNRRRFGRDACDRLQLIARLRQAGLGLREIRALLEVDDPPGEQRVWMIVEAITARLARLDAESAQARTLLSELQVARFEREQLADLVQGDACRLGRSDELLELFDDQQLHLAASETH